MVCMWFVCGNFDVFPKGDHAGCLFRGDIKIPNSRMTNIINRFVTSYTQIYTMC